MSVSTGPGQCSATSACRLRWTRWRSASASRIASSSCPATGMKSGIRSMGEIEVDDQQAEQHLALHGHARVAEQAPHEHHAVGHEARERGGLGPVPGGDEREQQRRVDGEQHPDGDQQRGERHGPRR